MRESLPLSIYTDVTVRSLDPKLLDRRVQGPSQIVLVRQIITIPTKPYQKDTRCFLNKDDDNDKNAP